MILISNLRLNSFLAIFLLFSTIAYGSSKIEDIFKQSSEIEEPMSMRDPFFAPKVGKRRLQKGKARGGKTTFSNIEQMPESQIDDLVVVGVIIGANRRAFVKLARGENQTSRETYVVKEGMKIGENNAELKAILPGGLVFVEKNTNIYGEDEYLETVVPISK